MTATPMKLRDGSWGARVQGPVSRDDVVTVTTKAGKTWVAKVAKVVWTDGQVTICVTQSAERPSRPRRAPNGECRCGACDDLMSMGYQAGQRIRCDECGGWAEVC